MLRLLGKVLTSRFTAAGVIALLAWQGWTAMGPAATPKMTARQRPAPADPASREQTGPAFAWPARALTWLAVVVMLPLAVAPLTRRMLEAESNAMNLALLAGLTAAGGLTAWALMEFRLAGWWAAPLLALAAGVAGVYNWFVLSKQEQLRH